LAPDIEGRMTYTICRANEVLGYQVEGKEKVDQSGKLLEFAGLNLDSEH
jgi:hypothetical protein